MARTDLTVPLNDTRPFASSGHRPVPGHRQGGFHPQNNLNLMPKDIIGARKSARSSLTQLSICILITCLKLQARLRNPTKPGPQEILCVSSSEACRKPTRIAFPQGIWKSQLLVGLEKGRGKRK